MQQDKFKFREFTAETRDNPLDGKNFKIICEGIGTVVAKTVSTKYC